MEEDKLAPVITLDGPSGSGKGTMAKKLSEILGWHLLDSGALYRILGFEAKRKHPELIETVDESELAIVASGLNIEFLPRSEITSHPYPVCVFLDHEDISESIRTEEAGKLASVVAELPAVRAALLAQQHESRQFPGLVADGRDMGTQIFPNAPLKFFLTASVEARASRRFNQLQEAGKNVSLPTLIEGLKARDARDSERKIAPLQPAVDAVVLDSTNLDVKAVFSALMAWVKERGFTV